MKMDVTSLLNSNSLAAEQQKKGEASRMPIRSRTPWDAGGYSLPINNMSSITTTQPSEIHHHDDSHAETPRSPYHKFSDSRSSLSSFTSSLQSSTHSRFSSMSTVSSVHPFNSIPLDGVLAEMAAKSAVPEQETQPLPMDGTQPPSSFGQLRGSLSPTESLDALATVAESRTFRQQSEPSTQTALVPTMSSNVEVDVGPKTDQSKSQERPSSPSDAILIKRSMVPTLRVNTGDSDLNGLKEALP